MNKCQVQKLPIYSWSMCGSNLASLGRSPGLRYCSLSRNAEMDSKMRICVTRTFYSGVKRPLIITPKFLGWKTDSKICVIWLILGFWWPLPPITPKAKCHFPISAAGSWGPDLVVYMFWIHSAIAMDIRALKMSFELLKFVKFWCFLLALCLSLGRWAQQM